ncbi:[weak similarity to] RNP-1 like RNA-binding protein [methanotrophic bacterial endosymbiont of Bathymodiolus sp.]|nr:[weak similarity to] RNP-1 like RNA-binding protein [methanotrophic bacterial endosymbiont of Bathymodiolus sp.]
MPKIGEAKVAMKNLNGKEVGNSKIRVKKAEQKTPDSKSDAAKADE